MLPDELELRHVGQRTGRKTALTELLGEQALDLPRRGGYSEADLLYSLGTGPAGAVQLHNFPRSLRPPFFRLDLAATDIYRCREVGVPRYNQFRELFHVGALAGIDQITPCQRWRDEIRDVYGDDIDKVDLLVGLFAGARPPGFAFSETAFRVFLLMAARRLSSDRFFTSSYREDVYTRAGIDWVEANSMKTVLCRHHPEFAPSLRGVENAFHPWSHTRRW